MRYHRLLGPFAVALLCVSAATIAYANKSDSYANAQPRGIAHGVQLAIQGPATASIGKPIFINVSLKNTSKSPVFIRYGSLELVQLHVTDSSGRVVPERGIVGITLLPHPYLADEDTKSVVLQRYAAIDRPGTYTVTAQLHVAFTNGNDVHTAVGAVLSSNSISVTVLP